ncbi:MAG: hypothetical protein ACI9HK_006245, partial [Pirellulaceae bacterium]
MLPSQFDRRDFLYGLGASLGGVALTDLMAQESSPPGPLAVKEPHLPAKAKSVIMLYMAGGPSHIDTFDPKPALDKLDRKKFVRNDKFASAMASGERYFVKSPFKFRRAGKSGIEMCEHFERLAGVADDLCVYRGCQAESINHPTANYHMNTGNRFGGDPGIGAWVTYGLGSVNQDLPGFIVLPEVAYPQGGAANWSNGFLPPYFQGTTLRGKGAPVLDLFPPPGVSRKQQRSTLDLLAELNQKHAENHPGHAELEARMQNYEMTFRMQTKVPDLLDISNETEQTRRMYGLNDPASEDFGRRCLLARRLVEKGVRFVQVYTAGWDSHDYIERAHAERIKSIDAPFAALIKDLKQRGMLDETLVVWTGEFGRSPDNGKRGGGQRAGRDHNAKGMGMVFAGGGVNAGSVVGGTDEIGEKAVEVVNPIRNVHVTMLRLLGLDDNKLTYFHGGRFKQL